MSVRANRSLLRRFVLRIILPYGTLLFLLAMVYLRLQAIKPITDAARAFNRRIANPTMMKLAGRRYWFASVIRHEGRRSGREYANPVVAVPAPDGFLISLPYGEGVDWLKNVLAAGRARIESRGKTWTVVEPEVVDHETVRPLLGRGMRLVFGLTGIERYLKVRKL